MNGEKTNKDEYKRAANTAYNTYCEVGKADFLIANILHGIGRSIANMADDIHAIREMMEKDNAD